MKTTTKALLAALTALSLGASLAQAQTATPKLQVPVVQADYDEDEDGAEGGGFLGLFGGHQGKHGGHESHERGEGDDDGGCRQGATDANGRCQMGQNGAQSSAPPANGLFNNGAAPKAQMN